MNALRSISVADDLNQIGTIEAFRPTRKAMKVVEAVIGKGESRATSVVAAYGAGKSMAALAGLELLVGKSGGADVLRKRIRDVDSDIAAYLDSVGRAVKTIVLCGNHSDLSVDLAQQANVKPQKDVLGTLKAIVAKARRQKVRCFAIVWDEFGLHLETLARDGRVEGLLEVQQMAEWAVRQKTPTVTFTTLMHKGVHSYTCRLPDSARSDWKKIEGRFETVTLTDSGSDVHKMIAEELGRKRCGDCAKLATRARRAGFFSEFEDDDVLAKVLSNTAPLSPAALDVLPRLAGQVAQHERTMFGFIRDVVVSASAKKKIGLAALYDYFALAMRADTGPGGTYRHLIEAETAIARTKSSLERLIVKSIALLQLGPGGDRAVLPLKRLVFSVAGDEGISGKKIEAVLNALVNRKIVAYRHRQDDILIWQGSDLNLAEMVREEMVRLKSTRGVVADLEEHFPAPAYLAPRYNHQNSVTRYAKARYVVAEDLLNRQRRGKLEEEAESEDALVALVIDATTDRKDLIRAAGRLPENMVVALPDRLADVGAMMLETVAIRNLRKRGDLAAEDPLAKSELDMMLGEVETAVRDSLDPMINPDRGQVAWFAGKGPKGKSRGGG